MSKTAVVTEKRIEPYRVACLQLELLGECLSEEEVQTYQQAALDKLARTIHSAKSSNRVPELRLVLVPEFWLVGQITSKNGDFAPDTIPGSITDGLKRIAKKEHCFIAANVIEREPDPAVAKERGRYNSAVIVSDAGELILHYREVASAAHASPDFPLKQMWTYEDASLDEIGATELPIVDTELGRLGIIIGSDIRYGGVAGYLCDAGADVIIHVCNEGEWCADVWQLAKRQRARENSVHVLSCNNAGNVIGIAGAGESSRGGSRITDWSGRVLAATSSHGEAIVETTITVVDRSERVTDHSFSPSEWSRHGVLHKASWQSKEAALPRAHGDVAIVVGASYETMDRTADTTTLRFSITRDGSVADAEFTSHLRLLDVANVGNRTFEWTEGENSKSLAVQGPIDFTRSSSASLMTLGIASDRDVVIPLGVHRTQVERGGSAVRAETVNGARFVVVALDGLPTEKEWQYALEWTRVLAWESEVGALLLGGRHVRKFSELSESGRITRSFGLIDENGELVQEGDLDPLEWRGRGTAILSEKALNGRRAHDNLRVRLEEYIGASSEAFKDSSL